jgi:carbon monoxide dehydrogenase subunit G
MLRRAACLLLILALSPGFAAESGPAPIELENVAVDYRNGVYFADLSLKVAVPPATAIEVLTDFEHMAAFVPNLVSSRIISRAGNVYLIAQQGRARFGPLSFSFESERRIELYPDGRLISQAVSGSTKYMRSELVVQGATGATSLDYHIEMTPERWLPSSIATSFMRHELAEQFTALAHEMERRHKSRRAP